MKAKFEKTWTSLILQLLLFLSRYFNFPLPCNVVLPVENEIRQKKRERSKFNVLLLPFFTNFKKGIFSNDEVKIFLISDNTSSSIDIKIFRT